MPSPTSIRIGKLQTKISRFSKRTGLKQADVLKMAVEELFARYTSDKELTEAIIRYRVASAKKEVA